MKAGRDIWWHERMKGVSAECAPASLPSEHPLFILYTSGTTGKPKGIVHTTGGLPAGRARHDQVRLRPAQDDVYWCTADVGWVTGHSYVVYGPLSNGATTSCTRGARPPEKDRFWTIVERHKVSIFYTAPTAIRAFVRWGDELPEEARSLVAAAARQRRRADQPRGLDVVPARSSAAGAARSSTPGGRPRRAASWCRRCRGSPPRSPGAARSRFFGVDPQVVKRDGAPCQPNERWLPGDRQALAGDAARHLGDHERYKKQYFSEIPGVYFTGDGVAQDKDGYFWVMGRVDDVLNVAGHRLGTAEIESALVSHPSVAEAAVVGPPHELKGRRSPRSSRRRAAYGAGAS